MINPEERAKPGIKGHSEQTRIEAIRILYIKGLSKYKLSKRYGVSHSTICRWSQEFPLHSSKLHLTAQEIALYRERQEAANKALTDKELIQQLRTHVDELEQEVSTLKAQLGAQ